MIKIFKTKVFGRWSEGEGLTDEDLCHAVDEIDRGLVEASLGAKLYKKRVARTGQGKSGGFRTIVTYQKEDRSIFLYGFGKGSKSNIL
ncbi:MAG: type II toxin-antitoxin system RelE/ParE family toxin, partial [Gammaproteobacteria bacterium]|nr:type II toxin-antitoxin system RelE/ParE family toxin [Gammaproteobacteria bacterium]